MAREYRDPASGTIYTEEAVANRPGGPGGLLLVGSREDREVRESEAAAAAESAAEAEAAAAAEAAGVSADGPRVTCWRRADGLLCSPDAHGNAIARGENPDLFIPYEVDGVVVALPLVTEVVTDEGATRSYPLWVDTARASAPATQTSNSDVVV